MHGGEALRGRLDEIAAQGAKKGWHAQVAALTKTQRGRAAAAETFNRRTLMSWLAEKTTPSAKNRAAIERAYLDDRKKGRSAQLAKQLANRPTGRRVEIYTENQPHTPRREPNIAPDDWEQIVQHWADGDQDGLDQDWADVVDGMDTSGNEADLMTNYVASLGF